MGVIEEVSGSLKFLDRMKRGMVEVEAQIDRRMTAARAKAGAGGINAGK